MLWCGYYCSSWSCPDNIPTLLSTPSSHLWTQDIVTPTKKICREGEGRSQCKTRFSVTWHHHHPTISLSSGQLWNNNTSITSEVYLFSGDQTSTCNIKIYCFACSKLLSAALTDSTHLLCHKKSGERAIIDAVILCQQSSVRSAVFSTQTAAVGHSCKYLHTRHSSVHSSFEHKSTTKLLRRISYSKDDF